MIYFGGSVFRTVPLTISEVLTVIAISFSVLPFEMVRRMFYKMRRK